MANQIAPAGGHTPKRRGYHRHGKPLKATPLRWVSPLLCGSAPAAGAPTPHVPGSAARPSAAHQLQHPLRAHNTRVAESADGSHTAPSAGAARGRPCGCVHPPLAQGQRLVQLPSAAVQVLASASLASLPEGPWGSFQLVPLPRAAPLPPPQQQPGWLDDAVLEPGSEPWSTLQASGGIGDIGRHCSLPGARRLGPGGTNSQCSMGKRARAC
mmetsp:Transcript_7642/g.20337  ORF Transcript_7642/g.20337 Transcript_7642/m.20337 type:complete len:212 (-) Transcript_7642:1433-2068(-)